MPQSQSMMPIATETILGHPDQIEAEQIVLGLLNDPEIITVQNKLKAELAGMKRGQQGDGAARIDIVIRQWTTSLMLDELN